MMSYTVVLPLNNHCWYWRLTDKWTPHKRKRKRKVANHILLPFEAPALEKSLREHYCWALLPKINCNTSKQRLTLQSYSYECFRKSKIWLDTCSTTPTSEMVKLELIEWSIHLSWQWSPLNIYSNVHSGYPQNYSIANTFQKANIPLLSKGQSLILPRTSFPSPTQWLQNTSTR